MELKSFNPDQVRKVKFYGLSRDNECYVIEMFDANNNMIAKIGHNKEDRKLIEFDLHENERIVGVVCSTREGRPGYAADLQFVICKKVR